MQAEQRGLGRRYRRHCLATPKTRLTHEHWDLLKGVCCRVQRATTSSFTISSQMFYVIAGIWDNHSCQMQMLAALVWDGKWLQGGRCMLSSRLTTNSYQKVGNACFVLRFRVMRDSRDRWLWLLHAYAWWRGARIRSFPTFV